MTLKFLSGLAVCLMVASCGKTPVRDAVTDVMTAPTLGSTRIEGAVGAKMDNFFEQRIFSDFARDSIFREAEDAFKNKIDDIVKAPIGYWQGEFWGKLMISASRVAQYSGDPELLRFISEEAHRLMAYQEKDGYLGTYADREFVCSRPDPEEAVPVMGWACDWCWNLWCRKYTMWGLLMCYQATSDETMLESVVKSMDQEIEMLHRLALKVSETGTAHFYGLPSCSVLKPLLQLYRITGYDRYLDFAKEIVSDWDCEDRHCPSLIANAFTDVPIHQWYENPNRWAKAYEMMSCVDGLLEYYRITGESRILEAVKRFQANVWATERNPMWNVGFNDQFSGGGILPNGASEPCDAIHWIRLNYDLFLITGDPQYVDVMEQTFFNAFLAGVYREGTWGARAVRSEGWHNTAHGQALMKYSHCCVDNMPRCFMDIAQTLVTRDAAGTLYVNWYSDSSASLDGATVKVTGNYPVSDKVSVTVSVDKPTVLKFRNPSWSAVTTLDGVPGDGVWIDTAVEEGSHTFELAFDMTPKVLDSDRESLQGVPDDDYRIVRWLSNEPEILPYLRREPCAQVVRGPMILAKSAYVGDTFEQMRYAGINRKGVSVASLEPVANDNVWGAWNLKLSDGTEVAVCDYSSACDSESFTGKYQFSIYF